MPEIFVLGYFLKRNGKPLRVLSRVIKCQVHVQKDHSELSVEDEWGREAKVD